MNSPSTPFPWKGVDGRGLAEGERERSQPPALRATSFQRKEGEVVKAIYPLPMEGGCPKGRGLAEGEKNEANLRRYAPPPSSGRREKSFSPL